MQTLRKLPTAAPNTNVSTNQYMSMSGHECGMRNVECGMETMTACLSYRIPHSAFRISYNTPNNTSVTS